jgi:hypothetical protein
MPYSENEKLRTILMLDLEAIELGLDVGYVPLKGNRKN